jgi:DNA protecting protein DprA
MGTLEQPCDRHTPADPTTGPARDGLPRLCDTHAAEERVALLALLTERPPLTEEKPGTTSWPALASEVALRGSAVALWEDLHADTLTAPDDTPLRQAAQRLRRWAQDGIELLTVLDADYPIMLRTIAQLPPLLFVDGHRRSSQPGVAIVGSRAATERGRSIAATLATALVGQEISIISGLADGIDTAAHQATLEAGGHPVGVLGTGITQIYPPAAASRALHQRVAGAGHLLSQFWPDAPPQRHHFPLRNITISGLGHAAIIVEAGEHSGTRGLAHAAVEHGRPVILTDHVAHSTDWGHSLTTRPGVYVAGSTADVLGIVTQILDDERRTDIATLAPAQASWDGT